LNPRRVSGSAETLEVEHATAVDLPEHERLTPALAPPLDVQRDIGGAA